MPLSDQYDALRQAAFHRFAQGDAELDPLLDSASDTRRGLTLLIRPPAAILSALQAVLTDFQRLEPAQYYYPASDIHLTILSLISCYPGFTLPQIEPATYQQAVRTILQAVRPFRVTYAGFTASAAGIMVQGFPDDDALNHLRNQVRDFFQHSNLPQSIDQRYRLQTAHSTLVRFRSQLQSPGALIEMLKKYQHHFIGSFEVDTAELVYNDWYQRAANTILLEKYHLQSVQPRRDNR